MLFQVRMDVSVPRDLPEQERARLLAEEPSTGNIIARMLMSNWTQIYPLGDPPDYEPPAERSVATSNTRTAYAAAPPRWNCSSERGACPCRRVARSMIGTSRSGSSLFIT